MKHLRGSCLCSRVQYKVTDVFNYSGYCHCSECRKFSGSAFSAFGGVDENCFEIELGGEFVAYYEKSENTRLAFCKVCGSSLFGKKVSSNMLHIRLGTLDEAPSQKPQAHVFVGSKADWFTFCDSLPQFDTVPVKENKK